MNECFLQVYFLLTTQYNLVICFEANLFTLTQISDAKCTMVLGSLLLNSTLVRWASLGTVCDNG